MVCVFWSLHFSHISCHRLTTGDLFTQHAPFLLGKHIRCKCFAVSKHPSCQMFRNLVSEFNPCQVSSWLQFEWKENKKLGRTRLFWRDIIKYLTQHFQLDLWKLSPYCNDRCQRTLQANMCNWSFVQCPITKNEITAQKYISVLGDLRNISFTGLHILYCVMVMICSLTYYTSFSNIPNNKTIPDTS